MRSWSMSDNRCRRCSGVVVLMILTTISILVGWGCGPLGVQAFFLSTLSRTTGRPLGKLLTDSGAPSSSSSSSLTTTSPQQVPEVSSSFGGKTAMNPSTRRHRSHSNQVDPFRAIQKQIWSWFLALAISSTVSMGMLSAPGAWAGDLNLDPSTPLTSLTSSSSPSTSVLLADAVLVEENSFNNNNNNKKYDGFAEYAKENQMEQSDVACFVQQCGDQTKDLFRNPRGIKGVTCLGRCKGEQACATRCFAEFGSDSLNNWLSCTLEEHACVKVPRSLDNSAENVGYTTTVRAFDPTTLIGTWYKTDGLNPNYDLFDCQINTFAVATTAEHDDEGGGAAAAPQQKKDNPPRELDMGIFFRVARPGGGFWENALTEHMVVDAMTAAAPPGVVGVAQAAATPDDTDRNLAQLNPTGRTMHTSGQMYGLSFAENWYILGESDGQGGIPSFKLVAYKGHTLQGNYEGAFVYAKEPVLPEAARPAVREAAARAGLDWEAFTRIDNTCPPGEALNDAVAGTGTSATDWIDLVVGEGGVIDWISPGWRGEYNQKR